jgi:nucleoside-diphosphate-sugar epimerase
VARILLTGAAGFIGFQTARQLLARGDLVVGVDNLNDYYDVRLKEHRLDLLRGQPGFSFQRLDIEDRAAVEGVVAGAGFDAVVNLAARAGVRYSMENPFVYLATNALGTLNLLEAMRAHGVPKLVLASTSSLYAGQPMPFHEELPVNTPISPYAASKKAAEVMAYSYRFLYGIDVTVVRYFTVYGPAGRPDMSLFRFVRWIDEGTPIELFGDGTQTRDFTFVDDIASGTIAALAPVGYEIVNLGGGREPTSLNDVIATIERRLGKKAVIDRKPFQKIDLQDTRADIGKARRLLGWEPRVGLAEGIERTIAWYEANRDLARAIRL